MTQLDPDIVDELRTDAAALLAEHLPTDITDEESRFQFLEARFDAGLAAVHYPSGLGGRGLPRRYQPVVDEVLAAAGAPDNNPAHIIVNMGMAGPLILAAGSPEHKERFMRRLWTGRDVWCQLFSEPGAGSDLAGLATRAVRDGDDWLITGQKVWTTLAHNADWAILLARTDPQLPKHKGITYFLLDMHQPGVTVRPLRQITGEAEFNEVFLDDARVPEDLRVGEIGDGWKLANLTLLNERSGGGHQPPREEGPIHTLLAKWRARSEKPEIYRDAITAAWIDAEADRLTRVDVARQMAVGTPPLHVTASKLANATTNQEISRLAMEVCEEDAFTFERSYDLFQPDLMSIDVTGTDEGYAYLRSRANSIEGGTSEIMRNIIAERILGMPTEPRTDKDIPFSEVPR